MHRISIVCCAYLIGLSALGGCASGIVPSQLEPPAKSLLSPSPKLADPKAGDDLVQEHTRLRRIYITETGKLARLQRYVRTIIKQ